MPDNGCVYYWAYNRCSRRSCRQTRNHQPHQYQDWIQFDSDGDPIIQADDEIDSDNQGRCNWGQWTIAEVSAEVSG